MRWNRKPTKKLPPVERGKKSRKSERTRAQILSAALKCFTSMGYSATSIQDIVDSADFTKPTLYYYFNSKADLFAALIDSALKDSQEFVTKLTKKEGTFKDVLVNILLSSSQRTHDKTSLTRLIHYSFFAAEREIPYRQKCFEEASKLYDILGNFFDSKKKEGVLKSDYESIDIAKAFLAYANSFTIEQVVNKAPVLTPKRAEMVIDMFLSGISK